MKNKLKKELKYFKRLRNEGGFEKDETILNNIHHLKTLLKLFKNYKYQKN
jgi:hypothetical protein